MNYSTVLCLLTYSEFILASKERLDVVSFLLYIIKFFNTYHKLLLSSFLSYGFNCCYKYACLVYPCLPTKEPKIEMVRSNLSSFYFW